MHRPGWNEIVLLASCAVALAAGCAGEGGGAGADAGADADTDTEGSPVDESCAIAGATYYLDAELGDDANDGSAGAPWRTIARAQAALAAGDGVLLRDGEYGAFDYAGPGYEDWVTWAAEDGHTPVLTALNVGSAAAEIDARLRFCRLTVRHPEPDPWPADDGLRHSVGEVLRVRDAHDVEVIGCTLRGVNKFLSNGVSVQGSDRFVIHRCDVGVVTDGLHAVACDDLTISYNHFHAMSEGSGIRFQGDTAGTLVVGNHVHDCHGDASEPYFPYADPNEWHVGSGISIRSAHARIRNNIVHDGFAQGLMFYADEDVDYAYGDMVVENNLFYDTGRVALYDVAEDVLVRNNTFISNLDVDGVGKYDILQRYNGGAYLGMAFDAAHDGAGVAIVNNVMVGRWSLPDAASPYGEDHNIFWLREEGDEILATGKGAHTRMAVWRDGPAEYALRGNPNFFEDIGFEGETPEYSFADDGVTPFFVDPGFAFGETGACADCGIAWDYRLAEGSPARDFGDAGNQPSDSLGSLGEDGFIRWDGPPRGADHHSAGCYELP